MGEPTLEPHVLATADRSHEESDVGIRPLAYFLAGLTLSLIVVGGICAWLFDVFERQSERRDPEPPPLARADQPTPGPQLQVSERRDLELMRRREERVLNSIEWVDKERGIMRIPIDRAIELTAERGLPRWPAAEVAPSAEGDEAERSPLQPVADSPAGPGQSTPAAGEPRP
jgi:hypothetical protein